MDREGTGTAPDLGGTMAREQSPSSVAGQFWSHAPAIWEQMNKQGIPCPELTEDQAASLYAYFASARYFEELGNAKRGKRVFHDLRCDGCHDTAASNPTHAKAVPSWGSLDDPIALACFLVNRPASMSRAVAAGKSSPAQLTSQEVTDLLIYLRHQPGTRGKEIQYSLPASFNAGRALFESEGCAKCHKGNLLLDERKSRLSMSGFIAAMWNHNPRIEVTRADLTREKLQAIAGYLWTTGVFDQRGDPARGERLYAKLGCGSCHNGPERWGPVLTGIQRENPLPFTVYLTAEVWNHGQEMLKSMQSKGIVWPKLDGSKMSDLAAYLEKQWSDGGLLDSGFKDGVVLLILGTVRRFCYDGLQRLPGSDAGAAASVLIIALRPPRGIASRRDTAARESAGSPGEGIGPPDTTSHVECTPEERESMGIPEGLIRYSVGIEDPDDLIGDLSQALDGNSKAGPGVAW
jgi:cytochrome c2